MKVVEVSLVHCTWERCPCIGFNFSTCPHCGMGMFPNPESVCGYCLNGDIDSDGVHTCLK